MSASPPMSSSDRFMRSSSSGKMRSFAVLCARRSASASPSPCMAHTSTSRPRPISPVISLSTVTDARLTRWMRQRMSCRLSTGSLGTLRILTDLAGEEEAREERGDRQEDREADVAGRRPVIAPFQHTRGVEREGRERGEAAEDAGPEKQSPCAFGIELRREPSRDESHGEGSRDVHDQRAERIARSEERLREQVDAMSHRPAEAGTEEDDEKALHAQGRRRRSSDQVCPTRSCPKEWCGSSWTSWKPARS